MDPLRDPSLLDENYAQYCVNTFLYRGTVRGFRESASVYSLKVGGAQQVYRIPSSNDVEQNFETSYWFEFADPYLTALRAPMVEDQFGRYYFFPSAGGAYFNTLANLEVTKPLTGVPGGPTTGMGWPLGIPAPVAAPGVTPPAGTDDTVAYLYTWMNAFNEEGPPSLPTLATGAAVGVSPWAITVTPPTAGQITTYNLASVNLYRTVTDAAGSTSYYLVTNEPIATTSYNDDTFDASITSNVQLPSANWTAPPSDLQGVVQMANGIMAGWSNKKEVWFSEAYVPHAWPANYALTVPYPIVGMAAVGSSLIILTEGPPSIATGVTPGTMTIGGVAANEPCISRGSIVASGEGVYYASPNGLILVNTSGTSSVSLNILQKEDWIGTNPYNHAGGKYSQAYFAVIKNSNAAVNGLILDHGAFTLTALYPAKLNTPFSWLELPNPVLNVYNDELSGQTFFIAGGTVYQWNPEVDSGLLTYTWRSKDFRFLFPQQFAAAIVLFNVPPTVTIPAPTSATRNTSQTQTFNPETQYLLLRVFADGEQVLVREIQTSGELILLPSGFKALYWSFQFEGQVEIRYAQFASSVKELKKV